MARRVRGPRTATQLKFYSLSTEYHSKALSTKENCTAIAGLQKAIWSHVAKRSMELETDTRIAKVGTNITWDKHKKRYILHISQILFSPRVFSYWKPVSRTETHKFNKSQLNAENKEKHSLIWDRFRVPNLKPRPDVILICNAEIVS